MSADSVSSSEAFLLDWMMCVIPGDCLFPPYSCTSCEIQQKKPIFNKKMISFAPDE